MPKYDWGLKWPDPETVPKWVTGAIVAGAGMFLLTGFIGAIWTIAHFFGALHSGNAEAIRNVGFIFLAVFGAPFVIWRAIVAQGNLDRSRDRDYADLFTKAVEQLGATREETEYDDDGKERKALKPNIEVRLGAIYALERISQDSERDHIAVMETLCAYVRENAKAERLACSVLPLKIKPPDTLIQGVISVLSKRERKRVEYEWERKYRLDFSGSDLSFIDFCGGNFSATLFHNCNLEASNFDKCTLIGTRFNNSILSLTRFVNTQLQGTIFDGADFGEIEFFTPSLGRIHSISIAGASLKKIEYIGERTEVRRIFGSKDTTLGYDLNQEKLVGAGLEFTIEILDKNGRNPRTQQMKEILKNNCFGHWFEHSRSDGAFFALYDRFAREHQLLDWPHREDRH